MAYTEFYCQNGGSNLNAGSSTNNTAPYTSTNGNWSTVTNIFTPTDGSTPASTVNVGDWASIYLDGATVTVSISRVTAVAAGVNGGITVSAAIRVGSAPVTGATGRTIKVGGAWQGPNGASAFPFTLTSWGINKDATSRMVRTNFKNDQTYSITAVFGTFGGGGGAANLIQGYTSSVNDGGRATIDGGTSTGSIIADVGVSGTSFTDIIFKTSITTGTLDLVTPTRLSTFTRCVFTGARNNGILIGAADSTLIECEAYDNNKANTAAKAGFTTSASVTLSRCIAHDNTGSNTSGFATSTGGVVFQNCISDTNGKYGIVITGTSQNGAVVINNCDLYNNGSDGINIVTGHVNPVWIENCNFIKNVGGGINNVSVVNYGFIYNCGYGSGTQANAADTINNLAQAGTVTYANNVTPWVDPANGDFRVSLAAANFAGRAAFLQTAASYAGTVGYPDIGAAQSLTGSGGTFSKEVSYGYGS